MAYKPLNTKTSGYDFKFVSEPPNSYICKICTFIAMDPQQMDCCGSIYCRLCLTEHKKHSNKCPQCNTKGKIFNDKRVSEDIKALKVNCKNLGKGCQWVGELSSLAEHLHTCDYISLPCTNKCTVNKQTVTVLRKDLAKHLTTDCTRRQYQCPHCHMIGQYNDITTTHIQKCTMLEVKCPNENCEENVPSCMLSEHRLSCIHEKVPCKYAELGCAEQPPRKDLKSHEEDDQGHLRVTKETVLELKGQLLQLKQQNRQLRAALHTNPTRTTTIEIREFERLKRGNKTIYSPSFLSHEKGYRFSLRVAPNGISAGQGTHVTVGVCLVKGENDKALTWPFTGSVTVKLLNQLEDKNHHGYAILFTAGNITSSRVTKRERQEAKGRAKFIAHSALEYTPAKNCQYLVRDVLYFRVSVNVPSYVYKPWLKCSQIE